MEDYVPTPCPTKEMVRYAMNRISHSQAFLTLTLIRNTLKLIVEANIECRVPKETELAKALYDGTDERSCQKVRVAVGRVRDQLRAYQTSMEATKDPIIITIADRGYKADWSFQAAVLVNVHHFTYTMRNRFCLPDELSTRWFNEGPDGVVDEIEKLVLRRSGF